MLKFQPKGGMCVKCRFMNEDCSQLPFHTYPPAMSAEERKRAVYRLEPIIVICKEFQRDDA
jgi:hypothetical protein